MLTNLVSLSSNVVKVRPQRDTFLAFLDPPSPHVSMFLILRVSKNWHFLIPPPSTSGYVIINGPQGFQVH